MKVVEERRNALKMIAPCLVNQNRNLFGVNTHNTSLLVQCTINKSLRQRNVVVSIFTEILFIYNT